MGRRTLRKPASTIGVGSKSVKNINLSSKVDGSSFVEDMAELSHKRTKLNEEIKEFSLTIKPIEFESYHDFFMIQTFKKGKSASGHVDIERLRCRNNGLYYRRLKRNLENSAGASNTPATNSALSEHENDEDEEDERHDPNRFFLADVDKILPDSNNGPKKRMTRAQLAAKKESEKESELHEKQVEKQAEKQGENSDKTLINCDISVTSIITKGESDGSIRRSSRLSQKFSQDSSLDSAGTMVTDANQTQIRDLYESLVPKVKDPFRRSDWVLPSRSRYTPEKQMRTKHSHEIIKVNELVGTDRIRSVLSKFEGGVAGIRKRS